MLILYIFYIDMDVLIVWITVNASFLFIIYIINVIKV